jgi:hypothetical protein
VKLCSPTNLVRVDNIACAFCGKSFDAQVRPTEDHLIGRKFVPRGSLAAQWNLIVNACQACNAEKCALENDISAISMRPDPRFNLHPLLLQEARRKETAKSQRTGKAVRDSVEETIVTGRIAPGVTFSFNLVCAPQAEQRRIFRLAQFHIEALFYWITYNRTARRGGFIPGDFFRVGFVARGDWGNAQMIGFQRLIADWPLRVHAVGAESFFRAIIRRCPGDGPPVWAWALEWNHNFRVIGFMGDETTARAEFNNLPALEKVLVERGMDPERGPFETWARSEVAIPEADDKLFEPPPEEIVAGQDAAPA